MTLHDEQQLRVLEFIHDHDESDQNAATIGGVRKLVGSENEAATILVTLQDGNLITRDPSLVPRYHITGLGRSAVSKVRKRRIDRGYRRHECREALLRWTDTYSDVQDTGRRVLLADFDGGADLVPFSDKEVTAALTYLADNGLVGAVRVMQDGGFHTWAWITDRGQEAIDWGGAFKYLAPSSGNTTNYTFGGTGNTIAAAIGPHSQATATSNFDPTKALEFAAAVRQALPVLNLPEEALAALAEIEQQEDPTLRQRATARLYQFVTDTSTSTLGQVLGVLGAGALGITP